MKKGGNFPPISKFPIDKRGNLCYNDYTVEGAMATPNKYFETRIYQWLSMTSAESM